MSYNHHSTRFTSKHIILAMMGFLSSTIIAFIITTIILHNLGYRTDFTSSIYRAFNIIRLSIIIVSYIGVLISSDSILGFVLTIVAMLLALLIIVYAIDKTKDMIKLKMKSLDANKLILVIVAIGLIFGIVAAIFHYFIWTILIILAIVVYATTSN